MVQQMAKTIHKKFLKQQKSVGKRVELPKVNTSYARNYSNDELNQKITEKEYKPNKSVAEFISQPTITSTPFERH